MIFTCPALLPIAKMRANLARTPILDSHTAPRLFKYNSFAGTTLYESLGCCTGLEVAGWTTSLAMERLEMSCRLALAGSVCFALSSTCEPCPELSSQRCLIFFWLSAAQRCHMEVIPFYLPVLAISSLGFCWPRGWIRTTVYGTNNETSLI